MTPVEKKAALAYSMFLKKMYRSYQRSWMFWCRNQHLYTNKEDASSPTAAIKSVFLTSVIDAKENRDVATNDVPGVFM